MIHPQAIIDPSAKLADDVTVGPWSFIGPGVELGPGCWVAPHVVLKGPMKAGKNNKFYQFASIGEDPQDKKFEGENSALEIGDNNIFRENVTINRGTKIGGGVTYIGSDNLFMAYTHVAHDCKIGNGVVFSNNASIAGHVTVEDHAILSGFSGVHQFCAIGTRAFLAAGSLVGKDVPPYVTVAGYPAKAYGLNTIGLRRSGFSEYTISMIKQAYKTIYRQGLSLEDALVQLQDTIREVPEVETFTNFIKNHIERGLIR